MHIDRIPVYRVYQRAIDLELYHAFAELVVQTSQDDTARRTYRQTRAMQIWQVETDVSGYFEPYHLRYPGEVLERFEEKLGNDVRVLRALALALGNTCAIQSDNMFVGNQRGAFLQKLRRSAGEDVYLQGALYLLETDAAQRHALLEKLAERECTRTEEALFVLSLFDDGERGYEVMHTQLSHLFTQNRTLSLVYDFGVLEWFIRFYAEQAKKYRGKADLVLRTLMKLPYMNMKPDSREFSVLTKAGYRCDEIILANSLAVWADRLPDRLSSKSIPIFEDKQVDYDIDIPEQPVRVRLDMDSYMRIVNNLIQNVIAHSHANKIKIVLSKKENNMKLLLADNGVGIEKDDLKHIFERLYKCDKGRSEKGSGLGLSIVHQFVEKMGGSITVESFPGEGTEFMLLFPLEI